MSYIQELDAYDFTSALMSFAYDHSVNRQYSSGAQPGFWKGGSPILGYSTKRGPGVLPPENFENRTCDFVRYVASIT